jgi:hypothetical protein
MSVQTTIASFDIGKHNFAFCVEVVRVGCGLRTFEEVCLDGTITHLELANLIHKKSHDPATEVFRFMDSHKTIWDHCNIFVVEQQVKLNQYAMRICHYVEAYLKLNYADFKSTIIFPARHKTEVFATTTMSKYQRKKLCTVKAKEILMARGDLKHLQRIKAGTKQDDLSDVICQLQAYKWLKLG